MREGGRERSRERRGGGRKKFTLTLGLGKNFSSLSHTHPL